jgi:hypothetical protein
MGQAILQKDNITITKEFMDNKNKITVNKIIAICCNVLATGSFIYIAYLSFSTNNIDMLKIWWIIPIGFLGLSCLFRMHEIGLALMAIIDFLNVGGMPIVGIIVLAILAAVYFKSNEVRILEALKYIGGFTIGAFIQKKTTKSTK